MNTFFDPMYYIQFLYFFFAAFIAFYVPGSILLEKLKIENKFVNITYSFVVGIVFWSLQGFIFGYLDLRNLTHLYLLIFIILWISIRLKNLHKIKINFKFSKNDLIVFLLLFTGVFIQLSFTFYNGVLTNSGMNFCCQTPDNLYHIGLTDALVKNMPPFEPAMYGVLVKNYHFLANLVSAEMVRIFHLDLIFTQYHYMVLLVSVLLGLSGIALSKVLKLGSLYSSFLIFFIFFAGDITFLLTFLNGKGFNFNFPFLYDATALWYSPPRVYAFAIILTGAGLFSYWIKNKSYYFSFILATIFATLVGFKIYNGIGIFAGLSILCLYFIFKKQYKGIILFLLCLIIGLVIYLPVNSGASGISYVGFWRVENFVAQPGLGLEHMELARQIYKDHNNIPRMIQYEIMYMIFYFIFVFGSLNIAFFQNRKTLSFFPKELNILLITSVFVSLLLGFFTFQKIGGSNTSQFLISFEMIASIYAAAISTFIYRKFGALKFVILAIIILFTVPRVLHKSIVNYNDLNNLRNLIISQDELNALKYIENNTSSSALIFTDNKSLEIDKTCYYVGFLSKRNLFLCNAEGILTDHGIDVSERSKVYEDIYSNLTSKKLENILTKNKIDYLYLSSNKNPNIYISNKLEKVFKNNKITIIKVKY